METNTQNVHETTVESGDVVEKNTEVSNSRNSTVSGTNIIERVVWFVISFIEALLAIRFVLALLGANTTNAFADFIYTTSHMFVSPFFSLFAYNDYVNGVSRFEGYTIVAMIVYLLIGVGLARLVTLTSKR